MKRRVRFKAARQRGILVVFLTLGVALVVGAYAVLRLYVLPAFEDLERKQSLEHIARMDGVLDSDLESLWIYNVEFASRDDTYNFMLQPESSASYIESNMSAEDWPEAKTEFMLLFDIAGQLVWGQVLNPQDLTPDSRLQNKLLSRMRPGHALLASKAGSNAFRGIVDTPAGLALVVSNPILRTDDSGPASGTLISGHFITPKRTVEIGKRVGSDVEIVRLADPHRPLRQRKTIEEFVESGVPALTKTDARYIVSLKRISDIAGNPIAVIGVSAPRIISSIGTDVVYTAWLWQSLAIVLFIYLTWSYLRSSMVSLLSAVINHIIGIRESGDLQAVFGYRGVYEIGNLAVEFDGLTAALGETQRKLEKARDEAEASSQARGQLLANMSHEIRTPLNGVIGMTELLLRSNLEEKQRQMVQTVKASGAHLLKIINDVLDFSRISAGMMPIEKRAFSLRELVDELNLLMTEAAREKGIELRCRVGSEVPDLIVADDFRLRQILINLLGNALKFTEEGGVSLYVDIPESGSGHLEPVRILEIRVVDTGIGIREQALSRIFESFSQANIGTAREFGGTGLGLAICKSLVEKMGGSIVVKSTCGEGTQFIFTLPIDTPGTRSRGEELRLLPNDNGVAFGKPDLTGMNVLVAEDNEINQDIIVSLLKELNAHIEIAANGEEVLNHLEAGFFDLIIMDCNMPLVDGYEAARQIRQRGFTAAGGIHLPILAMTANAMMGDRAKCLDAGMDEYISKPFKFDDLYELLGSLLPGNSNTKNEK